MNIIKNENDILKITFCCSRSAQDAKMYKFS